MGSFIDIAGKNYGLLRVVKRSGTAQNGHVQWLCHCSCGNTTKVSADKLKSGHTKSCGCLRHCVYSYKHGLIKSPAYYSWAGMLDRCRNNKNAAYKDYGGRGIKVYEPWLDFRNFVNDMGLVERGMTIERISVNGNYEPGNCRWAKKSEQNRNKRNNLKVLYQGHLKPLVVWADELGLNYHMVKKRLYRKWSPEDAFLRPSCRNKKQIQRSA